MERFEQLDLEHQCFNGKQMGRLKDPERIKTGLNNEISQKIKFRFSLVSNYEARVQMDSSTNGQNFSVPNVVYNRPVKEFEARFTQLGFKYPTTSDEQFRWSLSNIYTGEEIISTKNRKFLIQDKFSEIGLILPNSRIFGVGTSNRQFRLDTDSTYTLWSKGRQHEPMPEDTGIGGMKGQCIFESPFPPNKLYKQRNFILGSILLPRIGLLNFLI